jgi:hypothetical protein
MFAVGWVVVGKLVSRCGVSEFDEWIEEESEKKTIPLWYVCHVAKTKYQSTLNLCHIGCFLFLHSLGLTFNLIHTIWHSIEWTIQLNMTLWR